MHFMKIRKIAKERGVSPGKLSKVNLVRKIQQTEGNFDCYGTALSGECDQQDCFWREDCLEVSRVMSA